MLISAKPHKFVKSPLFSEPHQSEVWLNKFQMCAGSPKEARGFISFISLGQHNARLINISSRNVHQDPQPLANGFYQLVIGYIMDLATTSV
jgi:hypothetical protein